MVAFWSSREYYTAQPLLLLSIMMFTYAIRTVVTAVPGNDKVIQWRMEKVYSSYFYYRTVRVLHPSGAILFSARNTYVYPAYTYLGKRVSNTRYTDTTKGHIEFTLNGITMADAGDYKTEISSYIRTRATLITYVKLSKPILATADVPPVIGYTMTMECSSASNSKPDNHTLKMSFIWYRDGDALPNEARYKVSGNQLQVKNIRKSDSRAEFSCKALETQSLPSDLSNVYIFNTMDCGKSMFTAGLAMMVVASVLIILSAVITGTVLRRNRSHKEPESVYEDVKSRHPRETAKQNDCNLNLDDGSVVYQDLGQVDIPTVYENLRTRDIQVENQEQYIEVI